MVVEFLRLCVVVFTASLGYQLSQAVHADTVGPFPPMTLGLILGGAVGYVMGGVVARITFRSVVSAEMVLSAKSAEQLLAGLIGAVFGVLAAAALSWPLLLIASSYLMAPLFLFVVVAVGSLGYRIGVRGRQGVLSMLGGSGRLHTPQPPSTLPCVLDTSVAIDGRIVDVVRAGFFSGRVIVPQPVLGELQALADSADDHKRLKGRRGLDMLETLRQERTIDVEVVPDTATQMLEVDAKLMHISIEHGAALLTLDTNLARVAKVAGCSVMNLHSLALALRPPVLVGDQLVISLTRTGREPKQAIGHLDDGTMVVVERSAQCIGQDVRVIVTSVVVTANGRMVFGRLQTNASETTLVPDQRGAAIAATIAAAPRRESASPDTSARTSTRRRKETS